MVYYEITLKKLKLLMYVCYIFYYVILFNFFKLHDEIETNRNQQASVREIKGVVNIVSCSSLSSIFSVSRLGADPGGLQVALSL